jgi:hypothetical protein
LLHPVPQGLLDNSELGYLLRDPLLTGVRPGHALAGCGILDEAHPVPNQAANIEFVAKDAGASFGMTSDSRVTPPTSVRTWNLLFIEEAGDCDGALARCEQLENAAYGSGLVLVGPSISSNRIASRINLPNHLVPVRAAGGRLAPFNAAAQTAARLVGKILEIDRSRKSR